jgi:hypothetical protein
MPWEYIEILIGIVLVVVGLLAILICQSIYKADLQRRRAVELHEKAEDAIRFLNIGVCIARPGGQCTDCNTYLIRALRARDGRISQLPEEFVRSIFGGAIVTTAVFEARQLHLLLVGQLVTLSTPLGSESYKLSIAVAERGHPGQIAAMQVLEDFDQRSLAERLSKLIEVRLQAATVVVTVDGQTVAEFPDNARLTPGPALTPA